MASKSIIKRIASRVAPNVPAPAPAAALAPVAVASAECRCRQCLKRAPLMRFLRRARATHPALLR